MPITPEVFAKCRSELVAELRKLDATTRLPGSSHPIVLDVVDRQIATTATGLVDLAAVDATGRQLDSATAEDIARRVAGLSPEQAEGLAAELANAAFTLAGREARRTGRAGASLIGPAVDAILRHLYATASETYLWVLAALAIA